MRYISKVKQKVEASNKVAWYALEEFGCGVSLQNSLTKRYGNEVLFYCPMARSGALNIQEDAVVEEPESQEFLDAVNDIFKTKFKMKDFE